MGFLDIAIPYSVCVCGTAFFHIGILVGHLIGALMPSGTFLFNLGGTEYDLGGSNYRLNGVLTGNTKFDLFYQLPPDLPLEVTQVRTLFIVRFVAACVSIIHIFAWGTILLRYSRKADNKEAPDIAPLHNFVKFKSWMPSALVTLPALMSIVLLILDAVFITRAENLNVGLGVGIKVFAKGANCAALFIADALAGFFPIWWAAVFVNSRVRDAEASASNELLSLQDLQKKVDKYKAASRKPRSTR